MSRVKTFRITLSHGVPDKDIREFIDKAEAEIGIISVSTAFIPSTGEKVDSRLTVICTKLDDHGAD